MRAVIFDGAGGTEVIRLTEAPTPPLRPTDVLVRVHAAGVNRADILQRQGAYGAQPGYGDSEIPGLEIAGEVVQCGPDAASFHPGDRVMAVVGGGAYAEYARVDHRMCMRIPERLSYIEAAAIPEVFVTAHESLIHLGELQPKQWALIHAAAGGVGSAAIQLAHALGAHSVFTASGAARIARVQELGGTVGVDYKEDDFLEVVRNATANHGVDVVVDFIGAPYLERNLQALKPGGRLVEVGLLGGSDAKLSLSTLLYKHLRILGTVMKSRPFAEKLAMTERFRDRWLSAFDRGELKPIVDRVFPLAEAAAAHQTMESSGIVGKIILRME